MLKEIVEALKKFKVGQKISYKTVDGWVEVKIAQVLRNGNARFYIDGKEKEVEFSDTTMYKEVK